MATFTIGQLASKAGVNVETVRYYERTGLLESPVRRESGYRQYSDEQLNRIRFIKRAQQLGFTLKEIAELLSIRADATCEDMKNHVQAKLQDVSAKIRMLQKMKRILSNLEKSCTGSSGSRECPILEALERVVDDAES